MTINFDQPQRDPSGDTSIQDQRRNLESQILLLAENLKKLKEQLQAIQSLKGNEYHLLSIQNELETARKKLAKWPRGIFGIKDKEGYERCLAGIKKIEDELEEAKEDVQKAKLRVANYDGRTSKEIEREVESLEEKIKKIKLENRKVGLKLYERPGGHSLEEAVEMYGDLFFGPEEVQKVFGVTLRPEDIPVLPTREKLAKIKEMESKFKYLSVILTLKVDASGKAEWVLFPRSIVGETSHRNYIEETRGLRDFLKKFDLVTEEELIEVSDSVLDHLTELAKTDEEKALNYLMRLKINQNHRHALEDMVYFTRLFREEADDQKFTRDSHSRPFKQQDVLEDDFESTRSLVKDGERTRIRRIGKFTDPRQGGYVTEDQWPSADETFGWGSSYQTGIRPIL